MNYEKKYKEALERARKFNSGESLNIPDGITLCEYLFPELKDSEDERIRKELITHCRNTRCVTEEGAERIVKWIAWLEKQGEKKPADKTEPKLKVGDWCIDNEDGVIFQIVKVLDNTYTYKTNEGKEYSCTHYSLENDTKLWTIQDAKDGDVLVGKDDRPFIFTGEFDVQDDNPTAYCGINSNDKFITGKGSHWTFKDGIKPATKEQRDLLFRKMKEVGCEWDSEKKELKKIEVVSKESKDERIRKTIYGWIYTQPSEFFDYGFSKEEMLAWLEKH